MSRLARVSEDALRFHRDLLAAGGLEEGAELRLVETDERTDLYLVSFDVGGPVGNAALNW